MGKIKPRNVETASDETVCTCCERKLTGRKVAFLELDQRTGTYHDDGNIPAEKSQGWFPFGTTCASNKLQEHYEKIHGPNWPGHRNAA